MPAERDPSGTGHDTARDPLVAFCKGGAATCEICVGSCGIEEYEATAPGPASEEPENERRDTGVYPCFAPCGQPACQKLGCIRVYNARHGGFVV